MDKLTLDGRLLRQKSQVQGQLLVSSHNERIARLVELGPTRAAKDLQDIEHAQVNERALLGVVQLGALYNDGVRWQVDTPGQRGCAD